MNVLGLTTGPVAQSPAIARGEPAAGWSTENKQVLPGQLSDHLEGTKCPLQRQDTT